jgi:hypothetical protein
MLPCSQGRRRGELAPAACRVCKNLQLFLTSQVSSQRMLLTMLTTVGDRPTGMPTSPRVGLRGQQRYGEQAPAQRPAGRAATAGPPCLAGGRAPAKRRAPPYGGSCAANPESRSCKASRPHASRSQQHTARGSAPGKRRPAAWRGRQEAAAPGHGVSASEARARYPGGGDRDRACEVRSRLTRRRFPSVRRQSTAHQERSTRDQTRQKCSQGLDHGGHREGVITR